jgi:uncharacterized protein YxjI
VGLPYYTITRRILAVARSYRVQAENGDHPFTVAGRLGFARRFSIKDRSGVRLYSAREKLLALDPTFVIMHDGVEVALVKRTTTGGAPKDEFDIGLPSDAMTAAGRLWTEDGVSVVHQGRRVAMVRRKHEPLVRETFVLHTASDLDQALFLAIAMSIVDVDSPRRGRLPDPSGSLP